MKELSVLRNKTKWSKVAASEESAKDTTEEITLGFVAYSAMWVAGILYRLSPVTECLFISPVVACALKLHICHWFFKLLEPQACLPTDKSLQYSDSRAS